MFRQKAKIRGSGFFFVQPVSFSVRPICHFASNGLRHKPFPPKNPIICLKLIAALSAAIRCAAAPYDCCLRRRALPAGLLPCSINHVSCLTL